MKIHLFLLLGCLSLLVVACQSSGKGKSEDTFDCAATIAAIHALRANYPFPEHFGRNAVKQGGEFDPMLYFTVFDRLSMEEGYVLDFVYTNDRLGGYPTLLARPTDVPPYRSWEDVPAERDSYLNHVVADGSEESFFQLAVLSLIGEQFYLFWHANYYDWQIACNRDGVKAIIDDVNRSDFGASFTPLQKIRALAISNIPPTVQIGEETVEVRMVAFTRWGGFYRMVWTISRQFPHKFQPLQKEQLVQYECGIMF